MRSVAIGPSLACDGGPAGLVFCRPLGVTPLRRGLLRLAWGFGRDAAGAFAGADPDPPAG